MTDKWRVVLALSAVSMGVVQGCRISTGENGDKGVAIQSPIGNMSVKTDPATVAQKIGLPIYPGATQVQKDAKSDKNSADVDMSFGNFHLRVLAAEYRTADDPAKVERYYRQALAQYSDVIACRGKRPVGEPEKTGLGLTCSDNGNHLSTSSKQGDIRNEDDNDLELKAGSPKRQHIVSVSTKDGATHMGIVLLELPHGSDD